MSKKCAFPDAWDDDWESQADKADAAAAAANVEEEVKVTKADPNDAVAEILPDVKGDIQVGDRVLN